MESAVHHNLVKKIYNYVSTYPNIEKKLIESDIFEIKENVTRMLEGYIPDVYYNYNNITIIGEAKTENDLETAHSINQYISYLQHLKIHANNGSECVFIIAVPWQASISAYKIITAEYITYYL